MKRIVIIFKNHNRLECDVPDNFNLREIVPGMPIVFDNLYINKDEIITIEVKEI